MKRTIPTIKFNGFCLSTCLLPIVLSGCRSGGGGSNDAASVRLINAAPQTQDLSVSVDGQRVWKHSQYRSNTGFQGVGEGTYQINIDALVNGERRSGHNYLLCQKGKAYTVVAISQAANPSEPPGLRIFNEEKASPVPGDKVRLRFINAADDAGPVDVLFNSIVGFGEIPFGARTQSLLLEPGAYTVKVNAADEVRTYVGPVGLHFIPGHAYTLIAMGRRGAAVGSLGVSLEAYPDDQ